MALKDRTWIVIVGLVCCTILILCDRNGAINAIMASICASALGYDIYSEKKTPPGAP